MSIDRIVLITRATRLDGLIERFNTRAQARFYIEQAGGDFGAYEREHEAYRSAVDTLRAQVEPLAKVHAIERAFLPNYVFGAGDLALVIGVDGLVVNTAKYLSGQPLLAVNPDVQRIDGTLLPFTLENAAEGVRAVLQGRHALRTLSMACALLGDGQKLLAQNDLFIGARSHVSARYLLRFDGRSESQSSSGVIVSTGVGATGWLSSLFNMANGMLAFAGCDDQLERPQLSWEAERLLFVVREPFASKHSHARLVCGEITPMSTLVLESQMPSGGVIFSDGVENDFLEFNSGAVATITLAENKTSLVVPGKPSRRKL